MIGVYVGKSEPENPWKLFLEHIELGHDFSSALALCGLTKGEFYLKRRDDLGFSGEYDRALEQSALVVEDAMRTKALEGDVKAQQAFLQARMPSKYGQKALVSIDGQEVVERLKESAKKMVLPGDRNVAGKTTKGDKVLCDE